MAQAPGAVRVIKATIANPGASWATATFTPMQNGLPDLPVTRVLLRPARRDAGHDLRRDARRHLPDDRRRRELGAVRQRAADRARQRHLHAAGRRLHAHRHLRPRHLGAPADRAGEYDPHRRRARRATATVPWTTARSRASSRSRSRTRARTKSTVKLTVTSSNPNVTFPQGTSCHFPPVAEARAEYRIDPGGRERRGGAWKRPSSRSRSRPGSSGSRRLEGDCDPRRELRREAGRVDNGNGRVVQTAGPPGGSAACAHQTSPPSSAAPSPPSATSSGAREQLTVQGGRGRADEQTLVSPTTHVGAAPLSISFPHRFAFEARRLGWRRR